MLNITNPDTFILYIIPSNIVECGFCGWIGERHWHLPPPLLCCFRRVPDLDLGRSAYCCCSGKGKGLKQEASNTDRLQLCGTSSVGTGW